MVVIHRRPSPWLKVVHTPVFCRSHNPSTQVFLFLLLLVMSLPSTLLCLFPSTILVAGFDPWADSYEPATNLAVAQNIDPDGKKFKILDFSKDNDHEHSNGEYTTATLRAGPLPESITVCSAFMVEAWHTSFKQSRMFSLRDLKTCI